MALDRNLLNRLMAAEYPGRGTRPAPAREQFRRFTQKEFSAADLAERFHEHTQFTPRSAGVGDESTAALWESETLRFARRRAPPDYRGRESVSLPPPADSLGVDATDALGRSPPWNCSGAGLSRQQASTLLHYACGVPDRPDDERASTGDEPASTGDDIDRRTYPSTSGGFPIEPYLAVVNGGEGLDRGLYFYAARDHALRRVCAGHDEFVEAIATAFADARFDVDEAAACPVLAGAFWRAKARYGPRGYRLALVEAGHVMQNVRVVASAMGLASVPCASVREKRLESLFDADGVDESVAYAGAVGVPDDALGGSR